MTHPKLYEWCTDDSCPARESFQPVQHPGIWYVLAFDGDELLGLFCLAPQNGICWELHTRLLPASWGPLATAALEGLISWLWANTPCERLVTNVPDFNRLALKFARRAGLVEFGRNERSFKKHGKNHDQILFGVTKSEG
jgi:RimJ/RimL family protein N-acetyltransferase